MADADGNKPIGFWPSNRNLEALARQMYDYWFVQFDFPDENGNPYKSRGGSMVRDEKLKRYIPEKWRVIELNDFVELEDSKRIPLSTYQRENRKGKYPYYGATGIMDYIDDYIFDDEIILLAEDGSTSDSEGFPVVQYVWGKVWVNNHAHIIFPRNKSHKVFTYFMLKSIPVKLIETGSIQKKINQDNLLSYHILEVPTPILDSFSKRVTPIWKRKMLVIEEINSLIKQRDELLPLLMNGQVNSDLLAYIVVYCWEHQIPNNMKEKIIDNVMAAMQGVLDCQQMKLLKVTLQEKLRNVSVSLPEQIGGNNNLALLETFISAKRIEGCSERSLRYYRSSIEQFFQIVQVPITQIDTSSIRTYLAQYQAERKCSKVTIDNMRRILSSFFAWLEDEDYIVKSPVRRIHKVKTDSLVRETLSDEQLEQLRDRCCNSRDLAIIDMLSSTGMRVGELVKLNRQDVNFEERQCVVFGKGNKERVVYFNARTKIHLQTYLAERTDNNKALFVSLNAPHRRLQISGVERRIKKLGQSVHIERVHPHKFRRTLATVAIDKGMPIEQVQRLLGHVRIDTTLHYAMVSQQNVKMSHKKYLS